ncbi:MAG TPA: flagellar hook-basal body complex protein FliE [Alphaproteobacteria bacterium]|nr:flagellar hook-basal body complex protein FliE [Alphaproteobacteria bacterium]
MAANIINPAGAASAYAQAAGRILDVGAAQSGAAGAAQGGPSFADLVKDSIGDAVDTSKKSETASLNAIDGRADVVDLVTAINDAEMTLQTVVAVRDRVVQAYQEIMRMPI